LFGKGLNFTAKYWQTIHATNVKDAQVQNFMTNDELLQPILQAFTCCMLDVFSLYVLEQQFEASINSSPAVPLHCARHGHIQRGSCPGQWTVGSILLMNINSTGTAVHHTLKM
jgi:hypothetical protein